ncbi:MAG: hypothetical protein JOY61_17570 [Chloroflexi bacterium]|nr:hypothetical protein [Chloroflexota bacterium]
MGPHAPGGGPNPNDLIRMFCRRDDYAFLPPGAVGGIPCDSPTVHTRDPRAIAIEMWNELPLPQIKLGMNPQKGMVAVPTWFWIDGYDGSTFGTDETLAVPEERCHRVVDRAPGGNAALDAEGHVSTHTECETFWDSLSVEIGVWPQAYDWDFGDGGQHVNCPGIADCLAGVGRPYTDPFTGSPIAHAYTWSSLGKGGASDAYTITADITFAARFRFSLNGASGGGWETLNPRQVSTSATQKVQEAQAVLSRP